MSADQPRTGGAGGEPMSADEPRIGRRGGAVLATVALLLAVYAQWRQDGSPDIWLDPLVLFLAAVGLWAIALRTDSVRYHEEPARPRPGPAFTTRRAAYLALSGAIVLVSGVIWPAIMGPGGLGFLAYPGGPGSGTSHLTLIGLVLWGASLWFYLAAVADRPRPGGWPIGVTGSTLLIAVPIALLALGAIMILGAYFRVYDLSGVPLEMTSDHTEKLKDVARVLSGERPIFFHGNAGREAIQFYWTAALVRLGLENNFLTLKLGAALTSVLTLPVVFVLGRRVAGTEAGLFAAVILAMAPWHVQITRIGLRISWSPFFVALVLALLFRALSRGGRNDWLAAGLAAGVGVYGYTGYRPMALVIPATILIWAWSTWRAGGLDRAAFGIHGRHMLAAAGAGVVVLVPLARYAADMPEYFWIRTFSRVAESEVPIQGSVLGVLASNWRNALLMFNRTSDSAWFQSPPGRPALETVGGALVVLGVVTAIHRALRGDWRSAALLVAVPLLLASSALSLAFPHENPSLSRAAGAVIPVVVIAALAITAYGRVMTRGAGRAGTAVFMAVCVALFVWMGKNTSQRYFVEYRDSYNLSTHNTTELAGIVRTFLMMGGDLQHAYLVGWQHGPDYRAIGQLAGDLDWQGLLWGSSGDGSDAVMAADAHVSDPARKLYLVGGPQAQANIDHLLGLFPGAMVTHHLSRAPEKDFWSVMVAGQGAR